MASKKASLYDKPRGDAGEAKPKSESPKAEAKEAPREEGSKGKDRAPKDGKPEGETKGEGSEKEMKAGAKGHAPHEGESGDQPAHDIHQDITARHATERMALHEQHEMQRRDLHGQHRAEHRQMTERHEKAHKELENAK